MINISEERKKELMIQAKKHIKSKGVSLEPEIFETLVTKVYKELLQKEELKCQSSSIKNI